MKHGHFGQQGRAGPSTARFHMGGNAASNAAVPPSKIIFEGTFENSFYLYSCDTINGTAAVAPNIIGGGRDNDKHTYSFHDTNFFVVKNRNYWLSVFHEIMDEVS